MKAQMIHTIVPKIKLPTTIQVTQVLFIASLLPIFQVWTFVPTKIFSGKSIFSHF